MRPTRTIDDLIGKQVMVPQKFLVPRATHWRYAWFTTIRCKVVDVRLDEEGSLSAIYVVKAHEFIWRNRRRYVSKWRKTRVRLSIDLCNPPIQRYRSEGESAFRWRVCARAFGRIELALNPCTMARRQRGTSTKEWPWSGPTIAWWLNNPILIEQVVWKRDSFRT